MKRTTHSLLFLTAILLSVACNKQDEICWVCDLSNVPASSVQHPDKFEVCQVEKPTEWTDGQGNVIGGFPCHQK